ncbi:MAG: PepSY domain-containing protein, partial [Chitinophagales bacterium]
MKRGRKWLALILAAVFTITLTAPVFAAGEAQKDKISLEQAIKIVRQKLVVPDNCKDLQSRFEEDNKVPRWVLEYTDSRTGASFNAQVNAQTGEIIGMYSYKPSDGQNGNFSIPAL